MLHNLTQLGGKTAIKLNIQLQNVCHVEIEVKEREKDEDRMWERFSCSLLDDNKANKLVCVSEEKGNKNEYKLPDLHTVQASDITITSSNIKSKLCF